MGGVELREILSRNIKRFRGHRAWSQAELAERAGISIPFLSDIERGNKWPYPDTLSNLADALGIEVYELFRLEKSRQQPDNDWTAEVVKELLATMNQTAVRFCKEYGFDSEPRFASFLLRAD